MRIAMCFADMLYGGIERIGIDYAKLLISKGHDVDIYILNKKNIQDIVNEFPKECRVFTTQFDVKFCPEAYWRAATIYWWGKFLFPLAFLFFRSLLYVYKLFVSHKNNYDIGIAMSGHLNDLTYVAYDFIKVKKKCCWLHGGLYAYMTIIPGFQQLYMQIKNLVVLTDLVQDEILFFNKSLKKKLNIRKIYNPSYIADRFVDKNKVDIIKKKYGDFALMVARLTPQKNQKGVIKAFEYLYEKYSFTYNIVFVGDGPDMDDLREYSSKSPIASHIFFEGVQSDPQNYYQAANIFTFSSFAEGLPTVLIEAAYFGLPLVSSDTSVREILGNNEYGLISPIDDNIKLGDNIYKILSNGELYNYYSNEAKSRFQCFRPDVIADQIFDFFSNLK